MARIILTQNPQLEWHQSDAISYGVNGIAPLIKLTDQLGHYYTADQAEAKTLHKSRLLRDIGLLTLKAVANGSTEFRLFDAENDFNEALDLSEGLLRATTAIDNVTDMDDQRLMWAEQGATITSLGRLSAYRGVTNDSQERIERSLALFEEADGWLHSARNNYYTASNAIRAALSSRLLPGLTIRSHDTRRWMRTARKAASADKADPNAALAKGLVRKTRPLTFAPKNFVRKAIQTKP